MAVTTVGGTVVAVGAALILVLVAAEEAGGTGKQVTQGALVLVFFLGRSTSCATGEALGGASEHGTGRTGLSGRAITTHILVWLVDVDGLVLVVDVSVCSNAAIFAIGVETMGFFERDQGLPSITLRDFEF